MQKIIGYHGTKLCFADSIISSNFSIKQPKGTDNHWLGHGVYFYEDYELAEWWAKTKVTIHNRKYKINDKPIVIKAEIFVDNILNLDNPFQLRRFIDSCEKIEKEIQSSGAVLDFNNGDYSDKGNIIATQRKRCFFLDQVKIRDNIEMVVYTFSKDDSSYKESKYHMKVMENLGLHFNEKQICVTRVESIVDRYIIEEEQELFEEVIV